MAEAKNSQAFAASVAEPLRGCAGQPCALRTAPRLELSTHMQYASTALFCDLGMAPPSLRSSEVAFDQVACKIGERVTVFRLKTG